MFDLRGSLFTEWSHVVDLFDSAAGGAPKEATELVNKWTQSTQDGGFHWATMKAICRRQGYFKTNRKTYNMNDDFTTLITKFISPYWDKTFRIKVPARFDQKLDCTDSALYGVHNHFVKNQTGANELCELLEKKMEATRDDLHKPMMWAKEEFDRVQKETSRMIPSTLQAALKPTYDECAELRGRGSFKKTKDALKSGVQIAAGSMFTEARHLVDKAMRNEIKRIMEAFTAQQQSLLNELDKEYRSAIGRSQQSLSPIPDTFKIRARDLANRAIAAIDVME